MLRRHVDGRGYRQIAELLERPVTSIDDALQRVERTLEGHLQARAVADAG